MAIAHVFGSSERAPPPAADAMAAASQVTAPQTEGADFWKVNCHFAEVFTLANGGVLARFVHAELGILIDRVGRVCSRAKATLSLKSSATRPHTS